MTTIEITSETTLKDALCIFQTFFNTFMCDLNKHNHIFPYLPISEEKVCAELQALLIKYWRNDRERDKYIYEKYMPWQ